MQPRPSERISLVNESTQPHTKLTRLFEEEPVSLQTFIQDSKFLNADWMLSPIQQELVRIIERVYLPGLYPLMAEEWGGYWADPIPMKNLIVAQWGKGGGKDSTVRVASLRVAYMLMCMKSPQGYFGMPEDDSIHMLNIAMNSHQARTAFFDPLTKMVRRGWFKDKAETKQDHILYDKNIMAISGHSDAESQEGLNLILGVADEIDAFKAKNEMVGQGKRAREASTSAESILNMIKSSASTRFPANYKRVAISYPRYLGSTIQQLTFEAKEDINEVGDENSIYFASGPYATWDVNPLRTGPEEFASDYRKNPEEAAAKYECRPFRATDAYFRNPEIFKQAIDREEQPISVTYSLVSIKSPVTGVTVSGWEPNFHLAPDFRPIQGAIYALHGDLAIRGDRAGIAMSHVEEWAERDDLVVADDGEHSYQSQVVPIVRNDFTFGFEADIGESPPREIQIRWARMLAFELIKRGFMIGSFTFDGFQCLSGETLIPLLNGTTKPLRDLEGADPFWVYSIKDGKVVPGLATKAWKTGFRDDMVEVELDNGEKIRATSDHRFMLRNGSYRIASELKPDDSLMPLYRRMKKVSPTSAEYEQVWLPEPDGAGRRWKFTHSVVSHDQYGKLPKGSVTHHIDHSKTNNAPDNLVQLTNEEHYEWHTSKLWAEGEHPFSKLWADPDWSSAHKKRISSAQSLSQSGKTGKSSRRYRKDISFDDVVSAHSFVYRAGATATKDAVSARLGCSPDILYSRVRAAGFTSWKNFRDAHEDVSEWALYMRSWKKNKQVNNHKVVAVRSSYPEDVYDIEVADYHNFATSAGVFVHNSADTIQILLSHGIESDKVSTDRNPDIWKTLKDVASDYRLRMPFSQLLLNELEALSRLDNGKVDHPPTGSKDLADAFVCSILGAIAVGGEEDPGGNFVETGAAYFDAGGSFGIPEGMEDMDEFGGGMSLPLGMGSMGGDFYGRFD